MASDDRPVFDMDQIKKLRAELREFDKMDLNRVKFVLDGQEVHPSKALIKQFEFAGLNNSDFTWFYGASDEVPRGK